MGKLATTVELRNIFAKAWLEKSLNVTRYFSRLPRPFRERVGVGVRARETITSHFRIPPSGHLGPIFSRKILSVDLSTSAVLLHQRDPI
jgi:hypothetical protein